MRNSAETGVLREGWWVVWREEGEKGAIAAPTNGAVKRQIFIVP